MKRIIRFLEMLFLTRFSKYELTLILCGVTGLILAISLVLGWASNGVIVSPAWIKLSKGLAACLILAGIILKIVRVSKEFHKERCPV